MTQDEKYMREAIKQAKKAYALGGGKIPIQLYGDFCSNRQSTKLGEVTPEFCGSVQLSNLRDLLPGELTEAFIEGINRFGHIISGFNREDAILAGIESRTSSPVRIPRDEKLESQIQGLFPCGEGAGYAGGITSAAMDGIRTAEVLAEKYQPLLSEI